MLVLEVILVAVVLFAVAVLASGRGDGMARFPPDRPVPVLPDDRPIDPDDVDGLRFPLAFRGYRMTEVDDVLDRLVAALRDRDAEVAQLRRAVSGAQEHRQDEG